VFILGIASIYRLVSRISTLAIVLSQVSKFLDEASKF